MGYCKADDTQTCHECGALIVESYWPEHLAFHGQVAALVARLVSAEGLSDEGQA